MGGRIVTLSEGGLALITDLPVEQGDGLRLLVKAADGTKAIAVSVIVWNERSATSAAASSTLRRIGCVVSQPSQSYLDLLDRLMPSPAPARRDPIASPVAVPIAVPKRRDPESEWAEPDLPRSRELQPPPKTESEDTLPYFRVRMKQIGGPRTRVLTLRARSATQAETLAHEELARAIHDPEGWGILHIARISGNRLAH